MGSHSELGVKTENHYTGTLNVTEGLDFGNCMGSDNH